MVVLKAERVMGPVIMADVFVHGLEVEIHKDLLALIFVLVFVFW